MHRFTAVEKTLPGYQSLKAQEKKFLIHAAILSGFFAFPEGEGCGLFIQPDLLAFSIASAAFFPSSSI
jgi:hypothetical protein